MSKLLYCVRHGETVANSGAKVQDANDPLTDKGKAQAEKVAERLAHIELDALLVSDFLRAKQTAEAVSAKTGLLPEYTPLLREVSWQEKFHGRDRNHPEILDIYKTGFPVTEAEANAIWTESIDEIGNRARTFFEQALARDEQNICVVTHGLFLQFMLAHVLLGTVTSAEWKFFSGKARTANTGLTVFEYAPPTDAQNGVAFWRLKTWNDHAHLG